MPMCYTLYNIWKFARRGIPLNTFPVLIQDRVNAIIMRDLISIITPLWNTCMKLNPFLLKNIFNIYLFSFSLGLFKPLLRWLFKYSVGFLLTSVGIAWNEVLSGITLLKAISDYILSIVPIIPALHYIHTALIDSLPGDTSVTRPSSEVSHTPTPGRANQTTDLFTLIGLVLLGAGGVCLLVITTDYYYPQLIRSIPGMDSVLTSWYQCWDAITTWYLGEASGPTTPPSTPTSPTDISTDRISRTASGSSSSSSGSSGSSGSSTVYPNTPRPSRPSTPVLRPHGSNPVDPSVGGSLWGE